MLAVSAGGGFAGTDGLQVLALDLGVELGPIGVVVGGTTLVVDPGECVFHPVFVIAVSVVFTRVSTAAFEAVDGRLDCRGRVEHQVFKLHRFDQVGIPDQ